jgi:hypothetical protein
VGNTQQAKQAGLTMDKRRAADAGFRLKTLEGDVYITAEADIAALYGVCELLHKLGMRWFMPGPLGTVTPSLPTVVVPELDEVQRPSFPMRWVGREEWAYRNRCNNVRGDGRQSWGFSIRPGVYHADYTLLPVDEYYPRHPEYFALVNGERCSEKDTKLCVSDPEVVAEVARNMGKILDADPTIDLIGLAPTDGTNYCECEHCVAMDDVGERPADQKYSRRMLLYYNAVARELAKTHPEATILAGAYHWYNQPPLDDTIRAEPNLSLVVCHYTEYCSMHPVEQADCPRNRRYRDLLDNWDRLIPDIYFYEYYYTDGFRQFPCNLVHAVRQDIPYFHRRGTKGLYTQYGNIWNTHLNYYVAARLLWDVNADVDAILEDFYTRFYGPAAAPMKAYYELCSRVLAQTDRHLCTCSGGGIDMRVIFTAEVVAQMQELSDRAMALADTDIVRQRIEKTAACVQYTRRFTQYLDAYYANGPRTPNALWSLWRVCRRRSPPTAESGRAWWLPTHTIGEATCGRLGDWPTASARGRHPGTPWAPSPTDGASGWTRATLALRSGGTGRTWMRAIGRSCWSPNTGSIRATRATTASPGTAHPSHSARNRRRRSRRSTSPAWTPRPGCTWTVARLGITTAGTSPSPSRSPPTWSSPTGRWCWRCASTIPATTGACTVR